MKKKTKRGFVRFSTSQCSMSRHKKSFSWRSTEENSAKPTVCNPCPTAGRHGVTHTTQKPTTYVYIYGGKRVYVPGREQKSRVVNGGETTPPLVHPTALWTRPVDTPLEKSRLRGRAWPPEVNRWKTIENVIRDNQLSTYWPRLSFSRSFLSRSLKLKRIHRKKATSLTIGQSSLQSSGLFITSLRLLIKTYLLRNYQKYQWMENLQILSYDFPFTVDVVDWEGWSCCSLHLFYWSCEH